MHTACTGTTLRCRHLPSLRGRLDQHFAGGGTDFGQFVPPRGDAATAARDLVVQELLVAVLGPDWGGNNLDGIPVGFQLFCQQHRLTRMRALAHLRGRNDQRDPIVRSNPDPYSQLTLLRLGAAQIWSRTKNASDRQP